MRKNRRSEKVIDQLRQVARNHSSFEAHGFEASLDARKSRAANATMDGFTENQNSMRGSGTQLPTGLNLPNSAPTPGNVNAAAQFTIQVKRVSANIAGALPVMLFSPIDLINGYRKVLQGYIKPGAALTSVRYGENESLPNTVEFTYTEGVDVDTIEVTCPTAPYPMFLQSLITDMFRINKIRISLSDPAQISQFANEMMFQTGSMFGLASQNPVVPDNFRSPQQYQAGIVDVDVDASIDKQTGLIIPVNSVAGLQVSVNFFAPKFYQQSARYW